MTLVCTYTPSRRGLNRRNGKRAERSATHGNSPATETTSPATPTSFTDDSLARLRRMPNMQQEAGAYDNHTHTLPASSVVATAPWSLRSSDRSRLLDLFYTHFFRAHPFLVPKAFYPAQKYPRYLDLTVCLVGLQYAKPALEDAAALRDAVSLAMAESDERAVHRVQALTLYAIVLHSSQRPREAASCVGRAANIAISLGMNDPGFASTFARESPVLEESLRRSWWELFIVDVYTAAIHRHPAFQTSTASLQPLLPCAHTLYEAGRCEQNPPTLRNLDDRVFLADSHAAFSSSCFRVEAVRLIGRVSALAAADDTDPDNIQALDNALASWEYNLPPSSKDVVSASGEVDLMLFEARSIISCAVIFLHFPRSDLPATVPTASDIHCMRNHTQQPPISRQHSIKAIAASKNIANLASVPWPLEKHSPFFICALVLGCVVQLAAGSMHLHQCGLDCLQQHRDRVVLMLGALQRLGEMWPLAANAVRPLKTIAGIVLSARNEEVPSEPCSFQDSAIDPNESFNDMLWFDLFSAEDMQNNMLAM
ncbi:hypothetical protein WHR41_02730 [Cladosporium halotolerans]|uniref:Xylanolytic transcriptional activator regulatory domain-containing protein n=1 Tax=Cladosporium halotolerans TaxID=1052096 RepID=A0AB34KYG0_9PEZI